MYLWEFSIWVPPEPHLARHSPRRKCYYLIAHDKKQKLGIKLCKQDFIPSRAVLGEILKIGIPVAIQDGCIQIAFIIITVIANSRGLNDAAAVGIVEKVISALFIVPS